MTRRKRRSGQLWLFERETLEPTREALGGSLEDLKAVSVLSRKPVAGGVELEYGLGRRRWAVEVTAKGGAHDFVVSDRLQKEGKLFSATLTKMNAREPSVEAAILVRRKGYASIRNTLGMMLSVGDSLLDAEGVVLFREILKDVARMLGKKHYIAHYEEAEYRRVDDRTTFLKAVGFEEIERNTSRFSDEGDNVALLL